MLWLILLISLNFAAYGSNSTSTDGTLCDQTDYRLYPIVTLCSEYTAPTATAVDLEVGTISVMKVPAGTDGVYVQATADVDFELWLYDEAAPLCVSGASCPPGDQPGSRSYHGMQIAFSGDSGLPAPVQESITITGTTTRELIFQIVAWTNAPASIAWSHGDMSACPSPLPGCAACSAYMGCQPTETPTCDGTPNVFCTKTTTTSTTATTTTITSTITTTLPKYSVSGSLELHFGAGVDACAHATVQALRTGIAAACVQITSLSYTPSDLVVAVHGCSRRLGSEDNSASEDRRLANAPTIVSYTVQVPGVLNPSSAQALVSFIAANPQAFLSALISSMLSSSITVTSGAVGMPHSPSEALSLDTSLWSNDTRTDSCAGVASPRWRVVGRDVVSNWNVVAVHFYRDAACTDRIPSTSPGNRRAYRDGRAFGGPAKGRRVDAGSATASEVLEGKAMPSGFAWQGGPCGAFDDHCHLGFEWFTDITSATNPQPFARLPLGKKALMEPRCVVVDQAGVTGKYATTLVVQFRQDTDLNWQTLEVVSGLSGGPARLRLPLTTK